MKKKRILFSCTALSTFVKKDIELLSDKFEVDSYVFGSKQKWKLPFDFLKQFFFLLINIGKYDLFILQFAGYFSFLPTLFSKIFGIPSLIIAGGTESHGFKTIGYGNFQKPMVAFFTRLSFKLVSHISPKHASLINCNYTYDTNESPVNGLGAFMDISKMKFTVIENGYDGNKWFCNTPKIPDTFITAWHGGNFTFDYLRKGIDLLVGLAKRFPDIKFIIVGTPEGFDRSNVSNNVQTLPNLKPAELHKMFSEAEFYLQLSMAEGFPNALCEAMLCECVPIGTDVFAIPDIIGNTGFVLKHKTLDELEQLTKQALASNRALLGKAARKHMMESFPIINRKEKLTALCLELCRKK